MTQKEFLDRVISMALDEVIRNSLDNSPTEVGARFQGIRLVAQIGSQLLKEQEEE